MKKRNLICVASVLLITSTGLAQIPSAAVFDTRKMRRANIGHRVFMNSSAGLNLDPNSLDSVLKSLKTKGIYADEKSEINVHAEKNYIDLSCFNCIIVNVDAKREIEGARNDRQGTAE